jgi:hypothetical protein
VSRGRCSGLSRRAGDGSDTADVVLAKRDTPADDEPRQPEVTIATTSTDPTLRTFIQYVASERQRPGGSATTTRLAGLDFQAPRSDSFVQRAAGGQPCDAGGRYEQHQAEHQGGTRQAQPRGSSGAGTPSPEVELDPTDGDLARQHVHRRLALADYLAVAPRDTRASTAPIRASSSG